MAVIDIPEQGVELLGAPLLDNASSTSTSTPNLNTRQVMLLDLPGGFLEEILTNARLGGKDAQITLGKAPALTVKGKQHIVHITPNNSVMQTLYRIKKQEAQAQQERARKTLQREGLLARLIRLGEIKVTETDPALLALQRSLADAEKKKQSNTTVFLKDASKLPPAKGGKYPATKAKAGPLAFLKKSQVPGIFDQRKATTRSMPASPSLPAITPQKAVPDEKALKAEAMKTALIHLLAVRPVSRRFICNTLNCTEDEIEDLLRRYGRDSPIDKEKLMLSDKGYKELDVWKFQYQTQDDRQAAIDRAIKAYDRQRISREDQVWQLILPKEERGKGKILSHLNLHWPPGSSARTPHINVQDTDDTKTGGDATGTDGAGTDSDNRKGRLAPGDSKSVARSRSQDPIKKQRVSEKEARSRRLLSKNPKKATQSVRAKENKSAAKREAKRTNTAEADKVKSAEFVRDSDEDIEMEDAVNVETTKVNSRPVMTSKALSGNLTAKKDTVLQKVAPVTERVDPKRPVAKKTPSQKTSTAVSKAEPEKKAVLSSSSSSGSNNRLSDTSPTSTGMMRTLSHKRTTSSPIKPSPLGSTPPANASEIDNEKATPQGSSSSASPLVKIRRDIQTIKTNGVARPLNKASNVNPERGDSDRGLKRKANDLDSDIHSHGGLKVSGGVEPPAKRQQTYPDSPPTSDSSSAASPGISSSIIPLAQEFKRYYQTYQMAHREIADMAAPPQEKVDKVMRMHKRLVEMKAEITKAVRP